MRNKSKSPAKPTASHSYKAHTGADPLLNALSFLMGCGRAVWYFLVFCLFEHHVIGEKSLGEQLARRWHLTAHYKGGIRTCWAAISK
jgi:hypothetical protein